MSSASASPHGFVTVRGRGYRPEQVDACADALSRERDAAWERAARLTVLAREMGAELDRLRETVAGLAPQDYEALGERARRLFRLGQEEADAVRERGRCAAQELVDRARARGAEVRESARVEADAVRAEADEWARQRLLAARARADEVRIAARREVRAGRGEALAVVRVVRRRATSLLAGQAGEHAARWAEAEREEAGRAAALDACHEELLTRAERALAEAERALADAQEAAGRRQEQARALAEEIVAGARARAEGIARETERVLREHGERWDEVQDQISAFRGRLGTLSGRGVE
ncbi:cellulose-binding protein [Streptomyces sp. JHA26]|uniref:cellulose-binding protein n=1 Tax=Streptomyces sp. JHA26 TaxID=1917143 RepID=UPI00098AE770|nr:cellulose-binding protein [Streptomyces sp. JHA26]